MLALEIIRLLKKISKQLEEVSLRQEMVHEEIVALRVELKEFEDYTQRLEDKIQKTPDEHSMLN